MDALAFGNRTPCVAARQSAAAGRTPAAFGAKIQSSDSVHFSGRKKQDAPRENRLLIRMPDFANNPHWAKTMDDALVRAVTTPRVMQTSTALLHFIATEYKKYATLQATEHAPVEYHFTAADFKTLETVKSYDELSHFTDNKCAQLDAMNGSKKTPEERWHDIWHYAALCLAGTERTLDDGPTQTVITGRYSPYQKRAFRLMGVQSLYQARKASHQMSWQAPDGEIVLTQTKWAPHYGKLCWQHIPPSEIRKILHHVESLYQDTMRLPSRPGTFSPILRQVATMHWLLAHAMPYLRGSAGIADMFTKAVLDAKGIEVSPWKPGLAPDLEALVTPLPQFIQQYASYFEKAPRWIRQAG